MAFEKKTWKARVSDYPNRRTLTDSNNNSAVYTVSRNEGTVSEEGDAFSAANMNGLEGRIENAFKAEHTFLTGVLTAGATTIDFEDPSIVSGCMPHVYVPMEHSKLIYTSIQLVDTHKLRLTFPAQTEDVTIKVKIEIDQTPST